MKRRKNAAQNTTQRVETSQNPIAVTVQRSAWCRMEMRQRPREAKFAANGARKRRPNILGDRANGLACQSHNHCVANASKLATSIEARTILDWRDLISDMVPLSAQQPG